MRRPLDYAIQCLKLRAVVLTAAPNIDSFLQADYATAISKKIAKLAEVKIFNADFELHLCLSGRFDRCHERQLRAGMQTDC